jgi:hypothetical protein
MPVSAPELFTKESLIYKKFLDEVALPLAQDELDMFCNRVSAEFGITAEQVLLALKPILLNSEQYTGGKLIELSMGGTQAAESFEKMIAKIFEIDFGFEAEWTGRKKRKRIGGYMDVFVVETGRNLCGIIDTKSMKTYDLPTQDMGKVITNYIDAASELYGSRNLELKFVAYISHLIGSGAATRAKEIYDRKNVPISLISAYGLNTMRENYLYKNNSFLVTNALSKDPVNLIF